MLLNHFEVVRKHPFLKASLIVVIIESNMGYINTSQVACYIEALQREKPYLRPIKVDNSFDPLGQGRYGVFTGEAEKVLYMENFAEALKESLVCFADDFLPPFILDSQAEHHKEEAVSAMKAELYNQLNVYRDEIGEAANVHGKTKRTITGKIGDRPDDLALVVQILKEWTSRLLTNRSFQDTLRNLGIR